eukprot:11090304-Karenia_brevis.AAC.1
MKVPEAVQQQHDELVMAGMTLALVGEVVVNNADQSKEEKPFKRWPPLRKRVQKNFLKAAKACPFWVDEKEKPKDKTSKPRRGRGKGRGR